MKKLHIIILFIAVSFLFAGCEDDKIELTIKPSTAKQKPADDRKDTTSEQPIKEDPIINNTEEPQNPEINNDPLKDVIVPPEIKKKIEELLPTINTYDSSVIIEVRKYINSLNKVGHKALIDIVSDKNNPNRVYASAIIGMFLEKNYVPYLRKLIAGKEENEIVLQNLMKSLASTNTIKGAGLDYILEVYNKTNSVNKKVNILQLFIDTHTIVVYPILYKATMDKNPEIRSQAITTLGEIGWHKDSFTEKQIEEFCEIIANVMRNDEVEEIRNTALDAFTKIQDKKVSKYLVEFIKNKQNSYVYRAKAISFIAIRNDDRFNDVIIDQFSDPNWKIRKQSIMFFVNIKDKRCIPNLISMYRDDKNYHVRFQAFVSLSGYVDERVNKILLENIDNIDPDIASIAIRSVIYQGDNSVIDLLVKKFDHEDPQIRISAYIAVYQGSFKAKNPKYLSEFKRRFELEDEEGFKKDMQMMIDNLENIEKEKLQTQKNTETENQTQESKENDKEPK